jgi:hypothetical protein
LGNLGNSEDIGQLGPGGWKSLALSAFNKDQNLIIAYPILPGERCPDCDGWTALGWTALGWTGTGYDQREGYMWESALRPI